MKYSLKEMKKKIKENSLFVIFDFNIEDGRDVHAFDGKPYEVMEIDENLGAFVYKGEKDSSIVESLGCCYKKFVVEGV